MDTLGQLPSTALRALLGPFFFPSPSIRDHFLGWRLSDQYLKTAVISCPALTPTHTTAHTRGTAVQNTTWQTISKCLSENKESQVNRSKGL